MDDFRLFAVLRLRQNKQIFKAGFDLRLTERSLRNGAERAQDLERTYARIVFLNSQLSVFIILICRNGLSPFNFYLSCSTKGRNCFTLAQPPPSVSQNASVQAAAPVTA